MPMIRKIQIRGMFSATAAEAPVKFSSSLSTVSWIVGVRASPRRASRNVMKSSAIETVARLSFKINVGHAYLF